MAQTRRVLGKADINDKPRLCDQSVARASGRLRLEGVDSDLGALEPGGQLLLTMGIGSVSSPPSTAFSSRRWTRTSAM